MKTNEMITMLREQDNLFYNDVANRLEELSAINKHLEAKMARAREEKQYLREQYAELMSAVKMLYKNFPDTI